MKNKHEKDMEISIKATRHLMNIKSNKNPQTAERELNEWLAENPDNKAEMETMDMLWDFTEVFREHPLTQKDLKKSLFSRSSNLLKTWARKSRARSSRPYSFGLATALILVLVGIWVTQIPVLTQQTYRTATGEQRTLYLKDDLTVYLDTDTAISVNLAKERSHIELMKGHALFKVTNGTEHSLVVTAGEYSIFDIGTEFNVKMDHKGKISVAVLKGSVEIVKKHEKPKSIINKELKILEKKPVQTPRTIAAAAKLKPPSAPNVILPGQEIILDEKEKAHEVKIADTRRIDEWLNGRLYFDNVPLPDVLAEINRYLEKKIVIGDESLNKLHLTINFKISERKYFVKTISQILPLVAKNTIDGQHTLKRKK